MCVCVCVCVHNTRANEWEVYDGFFLSCEDFGRMFDLSFPAYAFFFSCSCLFFVLFLFVFCFEVEINSPCQDQYTMSQRAETTVAEYSLTICVRALFG